LAPGLEILLITDGYLVGKSGNEHPVREITNTLYHDEATIKGLIVDALEDTIVEVSGSPRNEEEFPVKADAIAARDEFSTAEEHMECMSQGTKRLSLPQLWASCAVHIIKYLTCDGRQSMFYNVHFKLLSHLCHNIVVNVPNFLYNFLKRMGYEYQRKSNKSALSHDCLVTLLVKRNLRV